MQKMTIEDKLGVNKFHTDEINSHIQVNKTYSDADEVQNVIKACPAGLYKLDDKGELLFDHLGCLECGTCRVISKDKVIEDWNYPIGTKGIEFRLG